MSEGIEQFLDFLREAEQQLHMAEQTEADAGAATQDLLHRLELGDVSEEDAVRLAWALRDARRERREAKDLREQAEPIAAWMENNRPVIKALERLLGEVRRLERRSQDRIYTPKTGILEEVLS